jgi:hypothetical protein
MLPSFKTLFSVHYSSNNFFWYSVFRFFLLFFSFHVFYLESERLNIKHASVIISTSHFSSAVCCRGILSDVFITNFITRSSHIHSFTTRRHAVLGKLAASLATANCQLVSKILDVPYVPYAYNTNRRNFMQIQRLQSVIHFIRSRNFHKIFPVCRITIKLINFCLLWSKQQLLADGPYRT